MRRKRSTIIPRGFRAIKAKGTVGAHLTPALPDTLTDAQREAIEAAREARRRNALDPVTVRALQRDNLLRYV